MRTPTQVLVYPVRFTGDDWDYLLLRRLPERGGFWQGVTGGVEEGENIDETARRELLEETGFAALVLERIDFSYSIPMQDEWRGLYPGGVRELVEYVFWARIDGAQEVRIDQCEHDAWRWCKFEDALSLLKWPENIEALKRCGRVLRRDA